jgi:hypothetical protein
MSGVEILRHVLFLLGCHSSGVRLTRDSPRAEQGPRYVILAQTGLSVVELSVTWFQIWPPSVGLLRSTLPAGRTRRSGRRILKLLQLSLFFAVPSPVPRTIARPKDRDESTMGDIATARRCLSPDCPAGCRHLLNTAGRSSTSGPRIRETDYLPGCSSKRSSPAATMTPVSACTLMGCSAMLLFEPPSSASERHADFFLSSSSISVNSASTTFSLPGGDSAPGEP